jgi:hypothetical protein
MRWQTAAELRRRNDTEGRKAGETKLENSCGPVFLIPSFFGEIRMKG